MARPAGRRKTTTRQPSVLQSSAVAIGGMIANNPVLVGGSTAFLVTLFYVSANALWYQPFAHQDAFFATRALERQDVSVIEPETTIAIERPVVNVAPAATPASPDPMVLSVQDILKALGFYAGAVDGIPGPATQYAVDAYRSKVGLPPGAIDQALLDQLGTTFTTGAVVPTPAPREAANPARETASPVANRDVRIVKVQAGLKAFGNSDIELDGIVGQRTRAAIKEFQVLFGLPETGEPDPVVYAKMREIGLTD